MIRKIEPKDYERVYELGRLLHDHYEKLYPFEELTKNDYFHALVYEKDGEILGFIVYTVLQDMVDLVDIVVDTNYRRQKVASNLIDYMITGLKQSDILSLEVAVDNLSAISLYEKFGFEIIHTRKNYYDEKDAYVMERVMTDE